MKILLPFFITPLLILFLVQESTGQQRFKAGLVAGLNASQILGDDVGGYNRLRLQGGLRAITVFTEKTDLIFEILYSQRGSYDKNGPLSPCSPAPLDIAANYIEIPIVLTYKDWLDEEGYYRIQVSGGLAYSRLLSSRAEGSCHDLQAENFNTNDYGFTMGVEYFTSEHFSLGMRWSRSFNLLYNKDKHEDGINSLRGYFLSFRGTYIF